MIFIKYLKLHKDYFSKIMLIMFKNINLFVKKYKKWKN